MRQAEGKVFLVMEFCSGGDLAQFIRRTGRAAESDARLFMDQLGAGLKVLRAHNLIHVRALVSSTPLPVDCGGARLEITRTGQATRVGFEAAGSRNRLEVGSGL